MHFSFFAGPTRANIHQAGVCSLARLRIEYFACWWEVHIFVDVGVASDIHLLTIVDCFLVLGSTQGDQYGKSEKRQREF